MRNLLTIAIGATFAATGAIAGEKISATEGADQFSIDNTNDVAHEPCPDYFDTDWAKVNDKTNPCWDDYQRAMGIDVADVDADMNNIEVEMDADAQATTRDRTTLRTTSMDRDLKRCDIEDLSDQALTSTEYNTELDATEDGDKMELAVDFDPDNRTAKSVSQLNDSDVRQRHLDATFAALDDDGSDAVDRGEALGVRGLADVFDKLDTNRDGVVTDAEFNLYFDGQLAENEALCLTESARTS